MSLGTCKHKSILPDVISKQEGLRIVQIARGSGYKTALDFVGHNHPELAPYLLSETPIDWIFHCYSGRNSRCLDLASGLGTLSFLLTAFFEEVVSLELDSSKLRFQQLRDKQDRVGNVSLIAADMLSLPFSNNEFDLIVANGILGWMGFGRHNHPRSAQLLFLKEMRRYLRPGGCLYVGTENRFGLQYLLRTGAYASSPNVDVLPKPLRDRTRFGYNAHIHSAMGYDSLLKEAGFGPVDYYWSFPSYRYPKFAGKLRDGKGYSFLARFHYTNFEDMHIFKRLASFAITLVPPAILAGILPLVWPNLLLFAWKDFRPETVEDAIGKQANAESLVRLSSGSKVSFIGLKNGRLQSYSKLSRCLRSQDLETEEQLLHTYTGVNFSKWSHGDFTVFTEGVINGRPLHFHSAIDNRNAIRWLLKFQDKTSSKSLVGAQATSEQKEIMGALSTLESSASQSKDTLAQVSELANILSASGVSTCSEHGDFWAKNILTSPEGQILVLDWEFYRFSGNPIFDFCFFIISNSSRPSKKTYEAFSENLSGCGPYSDVIRDIVRMFCSYKRIPVRTFLLGVPYALSRCVARHSAYSDSHSPRCYRFLRLLRLWNEKVRHSDFSWLE